MQMANSNLEIPAEGLKLVCVVGYMPNGNPIWKQAGVITVGRNGKPVILLDKTFNPAGVVDERKGSSIILSPVRYSPEELQKKESFSSTPRPKTGDIKPIREDYSRATPLPLPEVRGSSSNFDDMDDDIPF